MSGTVIQLKHFEILQRALRTEVKAHTHETLQRIFIAFSTRFRQKTQTQSNLFRKQMN